MEMLPKNTLIDDTVLRDRLMSAAGLRSRDKLAVTGRSSPFLLAARANIQVLSERNTSRDKTATKAHKIRKAPATVRPRSGQLTALVLAAKN
jgi:hypothetical protein